MCCLVWLLLRVWQPLDICRINNERSQAKMVGILQRCAASGCGFLCRFCVLCETGFCYVERRDSPTSVLSSVCLVRRQASGRPRGEDVYYRHRQICPSISTSISSGMHPRVHPHTRAYVCRGVVVDICVSSPSMECKSVAAAWEGGIGPLGLYIDVLQRR